MSLFRFEEYDLGIEERKPNFRERVGYGGLLLLCFFSLCLPCSPAEDGEVGILSELDSMEARLIGSPAQSAPLLVRLSNLEKLLFGAPRYGSLSQRLQSLKAALKEMPEKWSPDRPSPLAAPKNYEMRAEPESADAQLRSVKENLPPPRSAVSQERTQQALRIRKNYSGDILPLLNAFPPNFLRMEPDDSGLRARPDYFAEVKQASKGRSIRFKSVPVPVYIEPYKDRIFVATVLRAFEAWESRSSGAVKFSQVDDRNLARIIVSWKRLGAGQDRSGCLLGAHTILKYTDRGNGSLSFLSVGAVPVPIYVPRLGPKYTVPAQVIEVNLDLVDSKDNWSKYPCLQNITTHELGHALGLLGHSPFRSDMMYPETDEHSRLSQRDINTLLKLYGEKCDVPL